MYDIKPTAGFVLASFSLLCLVGTPGYGQTLYGSLVGNVKDGSDAVIVGAPVTVTNSQTNQSRETRTNESGSYSLSTVEPGTYTVRVTSAGFNTQTQSGVSITINSVTRADFTMNVGAVTETISVSSQA